MPYPFNGIPLRSGVPGASVYPQLAGGRGLGATAVPELTHDPSYKDWMAAAGQQFHTEFFDFAVDPTNDGANAIANNVTAIAVIQLTQEADFVAEKLTHFVQPLGALFSFRITDSGLGRALSNAFIFGPAGVGTAERPRIIKPRLFRRNNQITVELTNRSGGNITRLQVVLSGYKIYDRNALNLNLPLG